jgi:hypothetical protein
LSSVPEVSVIHLCEREIGFDNSEIGFPSIDGCRAIVLVTAGGLFGVHLNGKLTDAKQTAFVNFVAGHVQGTTAKRALYAASASAGMTLGPDQAELRGLAVALAYGGPIYWATLPAGGSAYVHYTDVNHTTCGITARMWNDPVDGADANRVANAPTPDRAMTHGAPNARVYATVDTNGLVAKYPTRI